MNKQTNKTNKQKDKQTMILMALFLYFLIKYISAPQSPEQNSLGFNRRTNLVPLWFELV